MTISIIIPTKNAGQLFTKCLDRISNQQCEDDLEITVVDSESTDNTLDIASKYGANTVTIQADKFTHGRARNLGASKSKGEQLVFCNQDAIPIGKYWLRNLLAPLSRSWIGASYSRQVAPDSPPHQRIVLSHYYPPRSNLNDLRMLRSRGPSDVVLFSTVSGAFRKEIWERFRFNEDIIMSEDQEIAARMILSGYSVAYCAESVVSHSHTYSLLDAFRRYFDSGWSMTNLKELRVNDPIKSASFLASVCAEITNDPSLGSVQKLKSLLFILFKTAGFCLGQFAVYMPEMLRSRVSYTRRRIGSP